MNAGRVSCSCHRPHYPHHKQTKLGKTEGQGGGRLKALIRASGSLRLSSTRTNRKFRARVPGGASATSTPPGVVTKRRPDAVRLSTGLPSRMSRPCPGVPAPPATRRIGTASIAARCAPVPRASASRAGPCCGYAAATPTFAPSFRARRWLQENDDSPQHERLGREGTFRLAGIFIQNVPLVSPGRAEVEDEVPIGLP